MNEILRMAFGALGVNKLRSFLTMSGITIGVFSVIGVMTAVSALRGSIEVGLSFLGSNMFQFSRFPAFGVNGNDEHKYLARRRFTLDQAQRYIEFMAGTADVICLKAFANGNPVVQASYGNHKTTKRVTFGGTNQYFLQDNDFEIYSNDTLIAAFAKVADVISSGALIISAIALLAAGVGIMNIMLVSVTERTKEIGVREAVGARKILILTQFLVESVVLSVTGGLVGILLGTIAGDVLASLLSAQIIFPWGWATAGVTACSAIGVVFGMYPAWKAASLDPIEALRFE